MRGKRTKAILAIAGVFAILVVLVALLWQHIMVVVWVLWSKSAQDGVDIEGVATVSNPVISPSGEFQLKVIEETIEGVRHNRFAIYRVSNGNIEPSPAYISTDAYRTRDALFFVWDDSDRVWVYSGDVGVFFWERVSDDSWRKRDYDGGVPVPTLLKRLRPEAFDGG